MALNFTSKLILWNNERNVAAVNTRPMELYVVFVILLSCYLCVSHRNGGWEFRFQDAWTPTRGERSWDRRNKVIQPVSASLLLHVFPSLQFRWYGKFMIFLVMCLLLCFQNMANQPVTKKSTTERSMLAETSSWKPEDRNAWQTFGFIWAPEKYRPLCSPQSWFWTRWDLILWPLHCIELHMYLWFYKRLLQLELLQMFNSFTQWAVVFSKSAPNLMSKFHDRQQINVSFTAFGRRS